MAKKCTMCGAEAKYWIKDTSDYYCEECAIDSFGDITVLVKVEEQAKALKEVIKEKMNMSDEEKQELNKQEVSEEKKE
tara:strand:- start:4285 stop:4518 length:234 start_codon:yes stop_codon:yes gene_type:complete